MTRDEAIEKVAWMHPRIQTSESAALWVDTFVALGMLKLELPDKRCATERAVDALFKRAVTSGGMITPRHAIAEIEAAGLKIVEK